MKNRFFTHYSVLTPNQTWTGNYDFYANALTMEAIEQAKKDLIKHLGVSSESKVTFTFIIQLSA